MTEYKLGDKVVITHALSREYADGINKWIDVELLEPREGIIISKRTLKNGSWGYADSPSSISIDGEYMGVEYVEEWQPLTNIEYIAAYGVASSLHRKPVYVLPEHITKLYTSTISTHHFNPDEPDVDTIHTFGSNDDGVTWELIGEQRVNLTEFVDKLLDMLTAEAQEVGDYD